MKEIENDATVQRPSQQLLYPCSKAFPHTSTHGGTNVAHP